MRVREDVSGGVDDETGADGTLPAKRQGRGAVLGGLDWTITGDHYLHDARGDFLDQRVDGFVELAECVVAAVLSRCCNRVGGDKRRSDENNQKSHLEEIAMNHGNLVVSLAPRI